MFLPCLNVTDIDEKVRILRRLSSEVQNDRRANEPVQGEIRDVITISAGNQVDGYIKVRTSVLSDMNVVGLPDRSPVVIGGYLFQCEWERALEGFRQNQTGRAL